MVNTAAVVRVVSSRDAQDVLPDSRPRSSPIRKAPPAPMPAASVAVNRPP